MNSSQRSRSHSSVSACPAKSPALALTGVAACYAAVAVALERATRAWGAGRDVGVALIVSLIGFATIHLAVGFEVTV